MGCAKARFIKIKDGLSCLTPPHTKMGKHCFTKNGYIPHARELPREHGLRAKSVAFAYIANAPTSRDSDNLFQDVTVRHHERQTGGGVLVGSAIEEKEATLTLHETCQPRSLHIGHLSSFGIMKTVLRYQPSAFLFMGCTAT